MDKLLHNRKIKLLIAFISLVLLLDLVQDTYAKYVSSAEASSEFTIARWSFLVNNQDVLSNNDFSNTIVPTFDSNANIQNGVIAPTSTGYFDIEVNSTNVGVAFDEVITLSQANTNTVSDIVFTGYKKNDGQVIAFTNNNTTITNIHPLNETTKVNTYRVYIMWNDNSQTETMNNAADTAASQNGVAAIDVNIQFIQRAS